MGGQDELNGKQVIIYSATMDSPALTMVRLGRPAYINTQRPVLAYNAVFMALSLVCIFMPLPIADLGRLAIVGLLTCWNAFH